MSEREGLADDTFGRALYRATAEASARLQDSLARHCAMILTEAEALEGTAAKVRAGSSGDKVAAWIEMSARCLRAALQEEDRNVG